MQYGAAINGIRRFASETERGGDRADRSVRRLDRSGSLLNRTFGRLDASRFQTLSLSALRASNSVDRLRGILLATTTLAGGLGAAFTVRGLQEYSDTWTKVGNRLRIVKKDVQDLRDLEDTIYRVAQRSRSQYEATGVLFARIATSAKRLNIAQTDTLRVTETIQKSFLVGGATPVEAAQSTIQLSQGIASNRLQGDELRSVLENPALGQLLADRITDGDIGKLRKLAADGELTAGVIVRAFRDASEEIDVLFAQTTQTIAEAFTRVDNAVMRSIGTSGSINSGARATVSVLNAIAENIDEIGDALVLLGVALGSRLGGKAVAGLTAYMSATNQARISTLDAMRAEQAEAASLEKLTAARLRAAQAAYANARAGAAFGTSQVKAGRELQAANAAHYAATQRASVATKEFNTALRNQTVVARATGLAMKGLGGALALVGGPVGAAFLALGATMFLLSNRAAEAEERLLEYTDAMSKAGESSEKTASSVDEAAKYFSRLTESADKATRNLNLNKAKQDAAALSLQLRAMASEANGAARDFSGGLARELNGLIEKLLRGEMNATEFGDAVKNIENADPDVSAILVEIAKVGLAAVGALGRVKALESGLADLGAIGKSGRPGTLDGKVIPIPEDIKDRLKSDLIEQKDDRVKAANEAGTLDEFTRRLFGLDPEDFGSKKKKSRLSDSEKQLKKFNESLAKLRQDKAAMFLSDLDQKVVDTAQSFGVAADEIDKFVKSGGGAGDVSPQIAQIRAELEKIADNEKLSAAIDDIADSFGDFFSDVLSGSESMGDAFLNLAKRLADVALQLFFIQPLVEGIKNSMRGGISGGGGFGSALGGLGSALLGGLTGLDSLFSYEGGGKTPQRPRVGGLDGFGGHLAMVHPNETIVDDIQPSGGMGAFQGDVAVAGPSYAPTYNIDARGADQAAIARLERALAKRDETFGRDVFKVMKSVPNRRVR